MDPFQSNTGRDDAGLPSLSPVLYGPKYRGVDGEQS